MKTILVDSKCKIPDVLRNLEDVVYLVEKTKSLGNHHGTSRVSVGEKHRGRLYVAEYEGQSYLFVGEPGWGLRTSPIVNATQDGNKILVETRNSIYTLEVYLPKPY